MNKGTIFGVSSGVLWAINSICIGLVLTDLNFGQYVALSPLIATFFNDLFSSIIISIHLLINRKKIQIGKVDKRNFLFILLASLLGAPVGMGGYVLSIGFLGVSYTATFSVLYPIFGVVCAFLLLKEKLNVSSLFGIALSVFSTMFLGFGGENQVLNVSVGLIGLLLCVVGWGLEGVILSKVMSNLDEKIILLFRQLTSVCSFLIILGFNMPVLTVFNIVLSHNGLVLLGCSALAGTVSYLFYYKAIHLLGPAKAMGLNISYSAWAVLFSVLFLNQSVDLKLLLCCFLIITGTLLTSDLTFKKE